MLIFYVIHWKISTMNQFTVSIWGDEGFSAILSMKSLPQIIKIIATDTSPPLWNITEHIAFKLFGINEIVIRGLAFLYFSLAVFFAYKIAEFLWDKKTAVIAAILTFLNPFFFIYAFEGRMYSILALGVTASMYFFLKIIFEPQKKPVFNRTGYILSTLWAMYSHHFAIFALIFQGLWFLYEWFKGNKKVATHLFKAFLFIGLGYLPWLIPLYNQTKMVGGGFWLGTPSFLDFLGLLGKYLGAGIIHQYRKIALAIMILILTLRKTSLKIRKDIILLGWFIFPIAATWIVSQKFQSIFFDRYLLYSIPGATILAASNRRKISQVLIVILIGFLLVIDFHYFTHPTKRPFRELSSYVKETRQNGDYLINWNAASHHLWETKFYNIPAPIYLPEQGELPFFVGTALMQDEDIIHELPEDAKRIGVVTSGPVDEVKLPGYTEKEVKSYPSLSFIWFEKQ